MIKPTAPIVALLLVISPAAWWTSSHASDSDRSPDRNRSLAPTPCDPDLVLGNQSCAKCHAAEIEVWRRTPHAKTFEELHRRPEAKQIAAKLGLKSIKYAGRCTACHYTPQRDPVGGNVHMIAGVSCESCHGAAKPWVDVHHDYGGEGITRFTESEAHRRQRIAASIQRGMKNPANLYLVAQSCLRCHTTGDEELVNIGGHPAGSLDFELVAWSQGTIRHNFLRVAGSPDQGSLPDPADATNAVSSHERLRVMFVAGIIAELEASLRATATATVKATYGITSAKRAARATARVKSVSAKVPDPLLQQIVATVEGVTLRLNNADELTYAADEVARLGIEFAATCSGESLQALDRYLPDPSTWK